MTRYALCFILAACVLAAGAAGQNAGQPAGGNPVLDMCWAKADRDIRLPAREAGVLVNLSVKDGQEVGALQAIGKIDDSQPRLQKEAAEFGRTAADERYKSDVEIRYSRAAADVAQAEYEKMQAAIQRTPNAVTATDMERARLDWNRATLQIEKAIHDQGLNKLEVSVKDAEVRLGELAIERRQVVAPWDGVVVELIRQQDEWVNPGDPILRLMRLNTMRVDANLDHKKYDPRNIAGCAVTVEAPLADNRTATFQGRIVYVSPVITSNGEYKVRAEVANRKDAGHWLLSDGHKLKMTIHLGTAGR